MKDRIKTLFYSSAMVKQGQILDVHFFFFGGGGTKIIARSAHTKHKVQSPLRLKGPRISKVLYM